MERNLSYVDVLKNIDVAIKMSYNEYNKKRKRLEKINSLFYK